MKLSETIMRSSEQSVAIFFQAMSQPKASSEVTESLTTSIRVGISKGNPSTGSKDEFLRARAATADTSVSAEEIPRLARKITVKNMALSCTGLPKKSPRKPQTTNAVKKSIMKW